MQAEKLYASDFGFTAADATTAFQNAIRSSADTIIVDLQSGDWKVGPSKFTDLQNKTIIFQPGVILKAKLGAFPNNGDCLINLVRANNIKIMGYGATLQMQKTEYAALADGEWRHCLAINNCNDVEVYGLSIKDSGGDGLYVSGDTWYGTQLYSENILLKDIWCDNNYRQGISVISAQHLHVQNCWFTNTNGTLPMSGVDLEPDKRFHRMVDVVFEKCRFTGNSGNGIQLSFWNLDSTSIPVDITFRDCYVSDNHDIDHPYAAAEIQATGEVPGSAMFERCMVENSNWTAAFIRKPADSYFIDFKDCVFKNVSQNTTASQYNNPIWLEVTDYSNPCPRFGGAAFTDCLLEFNTDYDFLNTYGNISTSPGLGNVQLNNLTVIHPDASVTYKTSNGGGSPSSDCLFDFQAFTEAPSAILTFDTGEDLSECSNKNGVLQLNLTPEDKTYPIGISYDVSGTAQQGTDFGLMSGFMIIPAQSLFKTDTLRILDDNLEEDIENITLTLRNSSLFNCLTSSQSVSVSDCKTSGLDELDPDQIISVFPNPATDFIQINISYDYISSIEIINSRGQVELSKEGNGRENKISIQGLNRGVYLVRVFVDGKYFIHKIFKQ
jgi:hypothetical protein